MANRYTQLIQASVPATIQDVISAKLTGDIALFNNDENKIVGVYGALYIDRSNLDMQYLAEKLEQWSKEHRGFTLLISREMTCVNDTNFYRLTDGKWYSVDSNVYSNISQDLHRNAGIYANTYAKYLVTRVDLAGVLAPMGISEGTEAVIVECKIRNMNQAAAQHNTFSQQGGRSTFGNPQNIQLMHGGFVSHNNFKR